MRLAPLALVTLLAAAPSAAAQDVDSSVFDGLRHTTDDGETVEDHSGRSSPWGDNHDIWIDRGLARVTAGGR